MTRLPLADEHGSENHSVEDDVPLQASSFENSCGPLLERFRVVPRCVCVVSGGFATDGSLKDRVVTVVKEVPKMLGNNP